MSHRQSRVVAHLLAATLVAFAGSGCAATTSAPVVTPAPPPSTAMTFSDELDTAAPTDQATVAAPAKPATAAAAPAKSTKSAAAPANPAKSAIAPAYPTTARSLLAPGATGDRVRELQARLKQLRWYDGNVSGTFDEPTAAGVRGFQAKRGLRATGAVDQATWDQLLSVTRQPTDDELHNRMTPGPALLARGSTGAQVRDLQARLKQIGWWSGDVADSYGPATVLAVQKFQAKRGIPVTGEVDQRTLEQLHARTRTPTTDELNNVKPAPAAPSTAGLDPRCLTGRALCVSKRTNKLVWVIDGVPQVRVDVRFGSQELPTNEGAFRVYAKSRDHVSSIYHSPMPYAMFFSGGQAVHYSPDFAANGYRGASHGCVNVRDLKTIASLFEQVRIGDAVIVYR